MLGGCLASDIRPHMGERWPDFDADSMSLDLYRRLVPAAHSARLSSYFLWVMFEGMVCMASGFGY